MTGHVFISYRRDDTAASAGRLSDNLKALLPKITVFMDIDGIEPGQDFADALTTNVERCDVLLAVIGKQWTSVTDAEGQRRLDNPNDYVRIEVSAALERNVRVIPVLVDGASMPNASQLPENLKPLARRHALSLSHTRFTKELGDLIAVLQKDFANAAQDAVPQLELRSPVPPPIPKPLAQPTLPFVPEEALKHHHPPQLPVNGSKPSAKEIIGYFSQCHGFQWVRVQQDKSSPGIAQSANEAVHRMVTGVPESESTLVYVRLRRLRDEASCIIVTSEAIYFQGSRVPIEMYCLSSSPDGQRVSAYILEAIGANYPIDEVFRVSSAFVALSRRDRSASSQ